MTAHHTPRVLFVLPGRSMPTDEAASYIRQLASHLALAGVELGVLPTGPQDAPLAAQICAATGAQRLPDGQMRAIAAGGWQVVHAHSDDVLAPAAALRAAQHAGLATVVTLFGARPGSWLAEAMRGPRCAVLRPVLQRADRLLALSRTEAARFAAQLGMPPERFDLLPGGVTPPYSSAPAPVAGALIASVGKLESYKGHQRVLAAMPRVLRERPDARLRIAGSGPLEHELRRTAERLGVAGQVEIGPLPQGDRNALPRLLQQAALVTLLSDYEPHPSVVFDARLLRRPLLLADASALHDVVARGYARGVSPGGDADEVARSILYQLRSPLIPPPVSLPTWEDCAADLLSIYRAALLERAGGRLVAA